MPGLTDAKMAAEINIVRRSDVNLHANVGTKCKR